MTGERRLIDANEITYHKSGFPKGDGFDSRLDWAFREDIDKLPTVDAVEAVHGEWVWKDLYGDGSFALCCSVCLGTDGARETAHYCPDCGAKMDGGINK